MNSSALKLPRLLALVLLSVSLISCSGSGVKIATNVPTIMLPDPPAYLRPVAVRDPKVGDDPLLAAAGYRQGLNQCNARINSGVSDWKGMQELYAQPVKAK